MNVLGKLRLEHNPMSQYLYIIHDTIKKEYWLWEMQSDDDECIVKMNILHPECKVVSIYKNIIK